MTPLDTLVARVQAAVADYITETSPTLDSLWQAIKKTAPASWSLELEEIAADETWNIHSAFYAATLWNLRKGSGIEKIASENLDTPVAALQDLLAQARARWPETTEEGA